MFQFITIIITDNDKFVNTLRHNIAVREEKAVPEHRDLWYVIGEALS